MYTVDFYIEPQDILNLLSREDKKQFNHCIFSDIQKNSKGGLIITCNLIEDSDVNLEPEYCYRLLSCDYESVKLHK